MNNPDLFPILCERTFSIVKESINFLNTKRRTGFELKKHIQFLCDENLPEFASKHSKKIVELIIVLVNYEFGRFEEPTLKDIIENLSHIFSVEEWIVRKTKLTLEKIHLQPSAPNFFSGGDENNHIGATVVQPPPFFRNISSKSQDIGNSEPKKQITGKKRRRKMENQLFPHGRVVQPPSKRVKRMNIRKKEEEKFSTNYLYLEIGEKYLSDNEVKKDFEAINKLKSSSNQGTTSIVKSRILSIGDRIEYLVRDNNHHELHRMNREKFEECLWRFVEEKLSSSTRKETIHHYYLEFSRLRNKRKSHQERRKLLEYHQPLINNPSSSMMMMSSHQQQQQQQQQVVYPTTINQHNIPNQPRFPHQQIQHQHHQGGNYNDSLAPMRDERRRLYPDVPTFRNLFPTDDNNNNSLEDLHNLRRRRRQRQKEENNERNSFFQEEQQQQQQRNEFEDQHRPLVVRRRRNKMNSMTIKSLPLNTRRSFINYFFLLILFLFILYLVM